MPSLFLFAYEATHINKDILMHITCHCGDIVYYPTFYSQILANADCQTIRYQLISDYSGPISSYRFAYVHILRSRSVIASRIWLGAQYHLMLKALLLQRACNQCGIICDASTEYSGKLSIVSVLHKVWFKHHLNDSLKERGRIDLFKLVMVSYQWILGFIVNWGC